MANARLSTDGIATHKISFASIINIYSNSGYSESSQGASVPVGSWSYWTVAQDTSPFKVPSGGTWVVAASYKGYDSNFEDVYYANNYCNAPIAGDTTIFNISSSEASDVTKYAFAYRLK